MTDLVEGLGNVQVKGKQGLHDLSVYLVVLIVKLLLLDKMQVVRQILSVPNMILNFL